MKNLLFAVAVSWVCITIGACNIVDLAKDVDKDLTVQFEKHKEQMFQFAFTGEVIDKKMVMMSKNTTDFLVVQLSKFDTTVNIVKQSCPPYFEFDGQGKLKIMVNNFIYNNVVLNQNLNKVSMSYELLLIDSTKKESHLEWLSREKGHWNKR